MKKKDTSLRKTSHKNPPKHPTPEPQVDTETDTSSFSDRDSESGENNTHDGTVFSSKADAELKDPRKVSKKTQPVRRDAGGREVPANETVSLDSDIAGQKYLWSRLQNFIKGKHRLNYYLNQARSLWVMSSALTKAYYLFISVSVIALLSFFAGADWEIITLLAAGIPLAVVLVLRIPEVLKTFTAIAVTLPTFWLAPSLTNAFFIQYESVANPFFVPSDEFNTSLFLYIAGFTFSTLIMVVFSDRKLWLSIILLGYVALIGGGLLSFMFPTLSIFSTFIAFLAVTLIRCDTVQHIVYTIRFWLLKNNPYVTALRQETHWYMLPYLNMNTLSERVSEESKGERNVRKSLFNLALGITMHNTTAPTVTPEPVPHTFNEHTENTFEGIRRDIARGAEKTTQKEKGHHPSTRRSSETNSHTYDNSGTHDLVQCENLLIANVRVRKGGVIDYLTVTDKGIFLIVVITADGPLQENWASGVMLPKDIKFHKYVEHFIQTRKEIVNAIRTQKSYFRFVMVFTGHKIPPTLNEESAIYEEGNNTPVGYIQLTTPRTLPHELSRGKTILKPYTKLATEMKLTRTWKKIRYTPFPTHTPPPHTPHANHPATQSPQSNLYTYHTTAGAFTHLTPATTPHPALANPNDHHIPLLAPTPQGKQETPLEVFTLTNSADAFPREGLWEKTKHKFMKNKTNENKKPTGLDTQIHLPLPAITPTLNKQKKEKPS